MSVSIHMHANIAVIAIDDGKKNVINHAILEKLEAAFDEAESNGAQAIVLKGREGCFCAGYDLSVRLGDDPEAGRRLGKRGIGLARRIYGCPLPVVALAQGHVLTIGGVWLACSDVSIGESGSYQYVMKEVALNVPLSDVVIGPLREKLHPKHELAALLHATTYSPAGALEAGFIDQLIAPGEGYRVALEKAATLAQLPRDAYHQTKISLRGAHLDAFDAYLVD